MKTILCFGDSNTHGSSPMFANGDWFRYGPDIRWPRRLASILGPDYHIIEDGLPGRTTCHDNPFDGEHKNGLRHLPVALECHAPFDLIIVMLGTNDLKSHLSLSAYDIAKGLNSFLRVIAASTAGPDGKAPEILVVSPVPILECGPSAEGLIGGAEKSNRLAAMFADVAQEFGAGFFDAGTVTTVSPDDGVHLTQDGHVAIAEALAPLVRAG